MSNISKEFQTEAKDKVKYKILNWSSYNKSLVNRGNITLYFEESSLENWYSDLPSQQGGQQIFSDYCIEVLLMLKNVFKLPYRQTEGFANSLINLMNIDYISIPSYSQINRRASSIQVSQYQIPKTGSVTIAIDSTGLKVYGEGEWKVRKHGYSKRRTWRKLHLGVDPQTGFIHCHCLTLNDVDDGSQMQGLIEQVDHEIDTAYLDGAYDHEHCWDELIELDIEPVIPPRKNAVPWYINKPGDLSEYPRNKAIRRIEKIGRKEWKIESGYHNRSLSETAMFRYKTLFGGNLYSRKFDTQSTENDVKIKILNIMTAQGMPISKPIINA